MLAGLGKWAGRRRGRYRALVLAVLRGDGPAYLTDLWVRYGLDPGRTRRALAELERHGEVCSWLASPSVPPVPDMDKPPLRRRLYAATRHDFPGGNPVRGHSEDGL